MADKPSVRSKLGPLPPQAFENDMDYVPPADLNRQQRELIEAAKSKLGLKKAEK
jgi:hypothetical protein